MKFFLLTIVIAFFAINVCFGDNPIVQTIYTADPAPMVHGGVFYVYSGHDEDYAGGWFWMDDWRCYSSTDMANWTDLGSPLDLNTFSWAASDAWAAHCTYRNGKFYFYATVKPKIGGWAIAVGVSNNPAGPFTDAIGGPLVYDANTGYIDPTVFIDDNGQAYMYWGNPGNWMVRLNEDMISTSGSIVEMPQNAQTVGNMYAEAPWFYKRKGIYYLVFATDDTGEQSVAYSTSTGPTGPWTFRSKIMNPSGTSWTLHPGIADYKDNSYIVYHTGSLPNGGNAFHRSVCVDKFSYNPDGTIPMIPITSSGPPQIGQLNPFNQVEAECIAWEVGVETENCSEGGMNVSDINNGDYIKVKGVNFGTGASSFEARIASATSGGNIEIRLDSPTGTLVGICSVAATGGWQNWATQSCSINASGIHDLYFVFTGGSGGLFNFNWWRFYGGSCTPTTITPYIQVNDGNWQQTSSVTVNSGDKVTFGPQPVSGGSWSWSGCGTSGTSREQTVYLTSSCTPTVTYTNTSGCQSTQNFNVTVSGGSSDIAEGGVYRITPRNGGKAVDVSGCGTANGTNVQNWTWLNNDCQQWQFNGVGDGYWKISPVYATGKAMDVSGVSTADGANVHIWDYLGGTNQQWQVVNLNNGYYQIVARHSGKCLDLSTGSTADGANIQQWTCSSSNTNQHFTFSRIKSTEKVLPESLTEYKLYPSPASKNLNITFRGQDNVNVKIYNSFGAMVHSSSFTGNSKALDVSKLSNGIYFIKLEGNKKIITGRFIKK